MKGGWLEGGRESWVLIIGSVFKKYTVGGRWDAVGWEVKWGSNHRKCI